MRLPLRSQTCKRTLWICFVVAGSASVIFQLFKLPSSFWEFGAARGLTLLQPRSYLRHVRGLFFFFFCSDSKVWRRLIIELLRLTAKSDSCQEGNNSSGMLWQNNSSACQRGLRRRQEMTCRAQSCLNLNTVFTICVLQGQWEDEKFLCTSQITFFFFLAGYKSSQLVELIFFFFKQTCYLAFTVDYLLLIEWMVIIVMMKCLHDILDI